MAIFLVLRFRDNAANMSQKEYSITEFYKDIENNDVEKVKVTKVMGSWNYKL